MKDIENIQRPNIYDYDIIPFSNEQKNIFDKMNISSLMITGKLLSIDPKDYKRLEKIEEQFLIVDKNKGYGMLFKFKEGDLKLVKIFEKDNTFVKD
mgnify:CR=1 FL=1